jgi:hypothetical protein
MHQEHCHNSNVASMSFNYPNAVLMSYIDYHNSPKHTNLPKIPKISKFINAWIMVNTLKHCQKTIGYGCGNMKQVPECINKINNNKSLIMQSTQVVNNAANTKSQEH